MEFLWKLILESAPDPRLPPLTAHHASLVYCVGVIHIRAVHPKKNQKTGQLFPRKLEPEISKRSTREREEEPDKWLAKILVYSSCFRSLCGQCLTGSWLRETWLSLYPYSCECTLRQHLWVRASNLSLRNPNERPPFVTEFLLFFSGRSSRLLRGRWHQCSVAAGTRLSWRPISSRTWARRLRLPSGKCWASHKSRITPVGLDLVAK